MTVRSWWSRSDLFDRFCIDVLGAELKRLRPQHDLVCSSLTPDTALDDGGLALDSLERLRFALALCEALQIAPEDPEDRLPAARTVGHMVADARALFSGRDGAIAFRSSGSQGLPRTVVHPWPVLQTELDFWATELAGVSRVVALVPSQHIYGFLFTIALPAMLGLPVIDQRNRMPSVVIAALEAVSSWLAIRCSGN